jgi:hypothetical protein
MSHCIESQGISIFISLNKHHVKIIKLNGSDPSKIYILCHVQFFEWWTVLKKIHKVQFELQIK